MDGVQAAEILPFLCLVHGRRAARLLAAERLLSESGLATFQLALDSPEVKTLREQTVIERYRVDDCEGCRMAYLRLAWGAPETRQLLEDDQNFASVDWLDEYLHQEG